MDPVSMMMIGGSALSAATTIGGGIAADRASKAQQQQMEMRANEELAGSQRAAANADRARQLAQSALVTQAGASGSGASDKTVRDLALGIEEEGVYNTRATVASGQARAQAARYEGALARWQGKRAKAASYFDAAGTLIGGAMKTPMAQRYATPGGGTYGRTGYG